MSDHDTLRALEAEIGALLARAPEWHELVRRARIGSRPDGYPARASGAEPSSGPSGAAHVAHTSQDAAGWYWVCTCGATTTTRYAEVDPAKQGAARHEERGSTIDYADPTGATVLARLGHRPDDVTAAARRLLRHVTTAAEELRYATLALDTLKAAQPDHGEPGCESCARITSPITDSPLWSPVHPQLSNRTTVAGRLKDARYLCRWCFDQVGLNHEDATLRTQGDAGLLPTRDQLRAHHAGRRLRRGGIVPGPRRS